MLLSASLYVRADHITGGEVFYTYSALGTNLFRYNITVKLFMDCRSPRQFNNPSTISIFNRGNGQRIRDISANLNSDNLIQLPNNNPCITDPPDVCYRVGIYEFTVDLPTNAEGYMITAQVNFRIYSLTNLEAGYGNVGATYTAEIPGTAQLNEAPANNSAQFTGSDLVVVCAGNDMKYSFAATDPDGDQLRYSFCNAWQTTSNGGSGGGGGSNVYPQPPPYVSVPYGNGFTATTPLGPDVRIDLNTGLITGIAPASGIYVVTVCVEEIRNGKVIARQRKDLQIKITACTIAAASLPVSYMLCRSTTTLQMENRSQSPLIRTYYWEIRDRDAIVLFTSTDPKPGFTFSDTGTFQVKLVINRGDQCADSVISPAYVYPGMLPAFDANGLCVNKATFFINNSTTRYGVLSSWDWEFGDASGNSSSQLRAPQHTYTSTGSKLVRLLVFNSNGCVDTAFNLIAIIDRPPITMAFRDTLICIPDNVQLIASGSGNFTWTPNTRISGANTGSPTVDPLTTTKYYVDLDESGCINRDSVLVRVVDHVSLQMMPDSTICLGDTIRLHMHSDGLQFNWSPGPNVLDPGSAAPRVASPSTMRYKVTARIGSCAAQGLVNITSVPYPFVSAGPDITICYQALAHLNGSTDGNKFAWTPSGPLNAVNTLDPFARLIVSTPFILTAWADKGCPKPSFDTAFITVLPKIIPFAGNDTNLVVGQPVHLKASGGVKYIWTPSTGLSDGNIADPVAFYPTSSPGIRYKVKVYDIGDCVDSAYLLVKVFDTKPSVFVPNAFTPNGDGKNDRFRFIAAGIKNVEFFRVYNRWGQLVYSNPIPGPGWDGTVAGKLQDAGTYVWMIRAIDYNGAVFMEKGQMILIR